MMLTVALSVLLAAAPLTPQSMEQQAAQHVLREFERVGRRAPMQDPALTEAARRLAREALSSRNPTGVPDLHSLTLAISDSGATDPSPFHVVIRAWAHSQAIETFLARQDFNTAPATHFGVGVVTAGERAALFLLLADRKANLQRFPRNFPRAGAAQMLCGELVAPLTRADVYVTLPDGNVDRVPLSRDTGSQFCAQLKFPKVGGYTVEVLGRAGKGPEVAALFLVDVGGPSQRGDEEPVSEPTTLEEARDAILRRINSLRHAYGLGAMTPDTTLDAVAQAYSDRMAREGFFGHVAPDGQDLRGRMAAQGPAYRSAGENLAMASGPLSAHFGIEHSPGHRKNLLASQFSRAGIGVTFQTVDGRPQAIVTEVFSAPVQLSAASDPVVETYKALDAIRKQYKLPPLKRSEALEQIATDHVKRALKQDTPKAHLPDSNVHERVFQSVPNARSAAVDIYVAEDPTAAPESKSLLDARNSQVGVGLVRGDSATFGKGRYWVVVIYTTPR